MSIIFLPYINNIFFQEQMTIRPSLLNIKDYVTFFISVMVKDSSLNDILPPSPPDGPVRQMVALYSYDPHALSPNVDSEVW